MKLKRLIWPVVIIVILCAAAAWKLSSNKNTMAANAAIANKKSTVFPVTVVSPRNETLSRNIEINGRFTPIHQLDLVTEAAGRVTSIALRNGTVVQKGQTVVQLDNEQINIDLTQAKATLAQAQMDLENYTEMLKRNAVNKQEVNNARLAVVNAETRVATLKRQLKATSIVSTVSGTVNSMSLEVGSFVTVGNLVARIADLSSLKMIVKLQPHEVVSVTKGQKVRIVPDMYTNDSFTGTVTSIGTIADGARKYDVEITLQNNAKTPLLSGMTGNAFFEFGGNRTALVIPVKCLVGSVQDPHVYVIENGKAVLKSIAIGTMQNDLVEIVSGVDPTQQVVESGQLNLANGSQIQIIK